jgi:hypothetical protein
LDADVDRTKHYSTLLDTTKTERIMRGYGKRHAMELAVAAILAKKDPNEKMMIVQCKRCPGPSEYLRGSLQAHREAIESFYQYRREQEDRVHSFQVLVQGGRRFEAIPNNWKIESDRCRSDNMYFYEKYVKGAPLTDIERSIFDKRKNGWQMAPWRGLDGRIVWMKEKDDVKESR